MPNTTSAPTSSSARTRACAPVTLACSVVPVMASRFLLLRWLSNGSGSIATKNPSCRGTKGGRVEWSGDLSDAPGDKYEGSHEGDATRPARLRSTSRDDRPTYRDLAIRTPDKSVLEWVSPVRKFS